MKKIFYILLFIFAGSANSALIDFDTLPGGGSLATNSILTNQYSNLGVTFSATENGSTVNSAAVSSYGQAGQGNYWGNTTNNHFGPRHDILSITFDNGASNVNWLTESHGGLSITFNAYDEYSNLLETIVSSGSWVATAFLSSGIYKIDALQPNDHWGWGLDNLSFDSNLSAVPVPAALWLFTPVLLGFFGMRKKLSDTTTA